ncbi:MAG TPA: hypothetical protein VG370_10505 [Chloroflexota bacterium]|nr:hypothetical protein [Chloroflexota bacterium]
MHNRGRRGDSEAGPSVQAGEKALKGYLTLHGAPFRPTHDLIELLAQCQALDAR